MANRPNNDSREAFDDMEQMAYEEMQSHLAEYPPLDDDYDGDEEDWEEYAEWEESLAERDRDYLLAQQELEDFEHCDEYYGYYGDSEAYDEY